MWVRYGIVVIAGFLAGGRMVEALEAWRHWRETAVSDPSAADLYRTTALVDLGIAGACVGLAALVWWLLRPPQGARLP